MQAHCREPCGPNANDIRPCRSVMGSLPGTDEAGDQQLHDQDAERPKVGKSKPVHSLDHPGPKIKPGELGTRDRQWTGIGSGVVSRAFTMRMVTTTKSGPPMSDIKMRRIWSLSTGMMIDEAGVDNTADEELHRLLEKIDSVRVELTLKDALALFERHVPDVAEIISQPRVCQEAAGRPFEGTSLRPGWSLDLTTADPRTGLRWELSQPEVQSRLRK